MMRHRFFESVKRIFREYALAAGIFILAVALFAAGALRIRETNKREALKVVKDSIQRAAVCCYAIEGRYPESFEYLEENYNIHVDSEKYVVFYEIFASNIMPEITVIER